MEFIFLNFSKRKRVLIQERTRIKMKKKRKPMKVRYHSRFFIQVGHETTSRVNHYFFTILKGDSMNLRPG